MIMGVYDEKTDMWSLGVVVFILIFKFNPFNPYGYQSNRYSEKICRNIMKGFSPEVKKGYGAFFPEKTPQNESIRDFISRLLVSDPEKRMSPKQALNHPWLTDGYS
jgi:serine/threonine protein kinase